MDLFLHLLTNTNRLKRSIRISRQNIEIHFNFFFFYLRLHDIYNDEGFKVNKYIVNGTTKMVQYLVGGYYNM